jgi:hypothetical protein
MVDTILNHLTYRGCFWIKTVCRAGKETINPYVKLLCALKIICYGISGNAFNDCHQFGETTSHSSLSYRVGTLSCSSRSISQEPSKSDARNITTMHKNVNKMPGMLGSLDGTKVHWKNCPTALKGQNQEKRSMLPLDWNL